MQNKIVNYAKIIMEKNKRHIFVEFWSSKGDTCGKTIGMKLVATNEQMLDD